MISKLYDGQGKEWKGTFRELARNNKHYSEKVWETKNEKWAIDPNGESVFTFELGNQIREIHYHSKWYPGYQEPETFVEYVWSNGKQTYPSVEE